ncbi:MAG TPA: ribosome biogenesis GTP-binding protein YihA/YsxC [Bacteroidales bacterium]|nr:ribosome biogenesis GTP-binding protein YihA/YsxC [Bacteroidales bacterium]
MEIKSAVFLCSNTNVLNCPKPDKPEYAFIGRSNVGKSSLINMITNKKNLAKISRTPGKTKLINHFLINNYWYLVDLPGLGYASTSKLNRKFFQNIVTEYLLKRKNLMSIFMLVDSRIPPQNIDLEIINQMGANNIPFVIIFTKTDALTKNSLNINLANFEKKLKEQWEKLPLIICSSAKTKKGRTEILDYIEKTNILFYQNFNKI